MDLSDILTFDSKKLLNSIPELISGTFPIPGKFRGALPSDIAELSKLLTNSRGDRSLSYLSRPNYLSAYLYYFLPWNLYRLCILLPSLELKLSAGNIITDFGCGPLTFVSALWIARPDLRVMPLEFNCADRAGPVLEAGKKFFTALCEFTGSGNSKESGSYNNASCAWKINLIKKDININKNASLYGSGGHNKAALVCAVNMFNEQYDRISHNNTAALRNLAKNAALFMHAEAEESASILTVEPGVPQSGKFISLLREAFIELGRMPSAPCAHTADCPLLHAANFSAQGMNEQRQPRSARQSTRGEHGRSESSGKKKDRWCHFAFETTDAPKKLMSLSAAAKLQKDRLVFSFLLAGEVKKAKAQSEKGVRVISDAFALPGGRFGRYACSEQGLALVTGGKNLIEKTGSLSLLSTGSLPEKGKFSSGNLTVTDQHDAKSGAVIMELK